MSDSGKRIDKLTLWYRVGLVALALVGFVLVVARPYLSPAAVGIARIGLLMAVLLLAVLLVWRIARTLRGRDAADD